MNEEDLESNVMNHDDIYSVGDEMICIPGFKAKGSDRQYKNNHLNAGRGYSPGRRFIVKSAKVSPDNLKAIYFFNNSYGVFHKAVRLTEECKLRKKKDLDLITKILEDE